jgi:uncharacterized integral membrane protein
MIDALVIGSPVHALGMAFAMGWEILWPLILGFLLFAVVQAVVSVGEPPFQARNSALDLGGTSKG